MLLLLFSLFPSSVETLPILGLCLKNNYNICTFIYVERFDISNIRTVNLYVFLILVMLLGTNMRSICKVCQTIVLFCISGIPALFILTFVLSIGW